MGPDEVRGPRYDSGEGKTALAQMEPTAAQEGCRSEDGVLFNGGEPCYHSLYPHVEYNFEQGYSGDKFTGADGGGAESAYNPTECVGVDAFHSLDQADDASAPESVPEREAIH